MRLMALGPGLVGAAALAEATEESGSPSALARSRSRVGGRQREWCAAGSPSPASAPLILPPTASPPIGDSYSGLIGPPLTFQIAKGIEMGDKPLLNLKGYIIGNPLTDRKFDLPARVPYSHRMGLISDEQYEKYRERCGADTGMNRNIQCKNCHDAIDKCLKGINIHHILESECFSEYNGNSDSGRTLLDYPGAELGLSDISSECREGYSMSSIWANNRAVRETLGVHKGTVPVWVRCNHGTPYTTDIRSSVEYHRSLAKRGYRSLIYSGDHDMTVPFIGTQAWIRSLRFAVVDQWRPWYATGQVAGFTTLYANNLTFATVKDGSLCEGEGESDASWSLFAWMCLVHLPTLPFALSF
ncbi:serine carboxypeptidase-like 17 [Hordeum vulgare subsp. vulgare]|uniref:serine carboxypeptidase-like 17 n=1 Tax=Hordeum vulgare subsp. vulgare TaxID=112509 RepID=UPI001D1A4DEF|nr:serine carboxypeptidase-like 17 [Hordeum vulgare subsp. vulgare]